MNRKYSLFLVLSIAVALGSSGCIHYVPLVASTTSIGPDEEVIGVGEGEGEGFAEAVKNACSQAGADTMINVFADSESQYSFLGGWYLTGMVRVRGTLIRYKHLTHNSPVNWPILPTKKQTLDQLNSTINSLSTGQNIKIELTDKSVISGKFRAYRNNDNEVWIQTGDGFFSSRTVPFANIQAITVLP